MKMNDIVRSHNCQLSYKELYRMKMNNIHCSKDVITVDSHSYEICYKEICFRRCISVENMDYIYKGEVQLIQSVYKMCILRCFRRKA